MSHRMHVESVYTQIEGRQVHVLKHLLEGLAMATLNVNDLPRDEDGKKESLKQEKGKDSTDIEKDNMWIELEQKGGAVAPQAVRWGCPLETHTITNDQYCTSTVFTDTSSVTTRLPVPYRVINAMPRTQLQ
ncbi:hypothetical protein EYF80_004250 [Liparis tanakae]|uniref:Uncharacterized protein n=1 Tax=Liparis tanakae TaxID=230148 RepID=A0A4Z2J6G6_9TELE|nr:hypothetical protein EYF80_004250 [Liparis tanakae]